MDLYQPTLYLLSFICRCEWNGDDCGPETFERILTDHGVCYQFTENSTQLMVSSSGKPVRKRKSLPPFIDSSHTIPYIVPSIAMWLGYGTFLSEVKVGLVIISAQ